MTFRFSAATRLAPSRSRRGWSSFTGTATCSWRTCCRPSWWRSCERTWTARWRRTERDPAGLIELHADVRDQPREPARSSTSSRSSASPRRSSTCDCHVIHNNSFRTRRAAASRPGTRTTRRTSCVTHGEPPTNIRLPVMLFTANYYLTDVDEVALRPAREVDPRLAPLRRSPPPEMEGTQWEKPRRLLPGPSRQRGDVQQPGLAPRRPQHQRPDALHDAGRATRAGSSATSTSRS